MSDDEEILDWDGFTEAPLATTGWRCLGAMPSRANRAAVVVRKALGTRSALLGPDSIEWCVPSPWLSISYAWRELPALVKYLVATPEARAGLADVSRLLGLMDGLAASGRQRLPPADHLLGDKLDVDLAIHKVLLRSDPRYFEGQPVHGEPHPDDAELLPLIRLAIPAWVTDRVTDDRIIEQLHRFRDVRPWPFDRLLEGS